MTEIILPAMGEGIIDATITKIFKKVGDKVEVDEPIVEVATDKVDSEIVSPVDGIISEIKYKEGDIVEIEQIIAIVLAEGEKAAGFSSKKLKVLKIEKTVKESSLVSNENESKTVFHKLSNGQFLSPLVRSIAKQENISTADLEKIQGTGLNARITKEDVLRFLQKKSNQSNSQSPDEISKKISNTSNANTSDNFEIVEMDRMRSLIADYMIESKRVSAHVTSFVEVDMTNIVNWRNRVKEQVLAREGEKITFMPIFIDAIVKALKEFPGVNVSVDGKKIIYKKNINVGMAAALPTGNLIVPVIKNADKLSLLGLTKEVNDLANRARNNKLQVTDITGGTFTITNMGTFGNITGTPIINQPEVAILAVGAIKKKPAVIETPDGDFIGIRQLMVMSMSYDHRVVDGAMGGMFLKKVADYLEKFDKNTVI